MQEDYREHEERGRISGNDLFDITNGRTPASSATDPGSLRVIKRTGEVVSFDQNNINLAISKAFIAVQGSASTTSNRVRKLIEELTLSVTQTIQSRYPTGGTVGIETIQDNVELALMRAGEQRIASAYVIYRNERKKAREEQEAREFKLDDSYLKVTRSDTSIAPLDEAGVKELLQECCEGLNEVDPETILANTLRDAYQQIPEEEVSKLLVINAKTLIEEEPNYSFVAARLQLDILRAEALKFLDYKIPGTYYRGYRVNQFQMKEIYPEIFPLFVKRGVELELLDPKLLEFDLEKLGQALQPERDMQFSLLGIQTLYDRYFIHAAKIRFELPQVFFMRVAAGLALEEQDKEERAIEFYNLLSTFDFVSSTPTLFNSATLRPQLSSCYLTTVPDDLRGIYGSILDNAMLSKWAGGLGNDWTNVRAHGSHIKGTNGESQGVVPFLKVVNDTAIAVNQGGKRNGAVCSYLEAWHLDIKDFLELRKNTGDDRRRTPDMHTAVWIPDLFMRRVVEEQDWTLFSPDNVPELHDNYGKEFERLYLDAEARTKTGEIKLYESVSALELWRSMLNMLFETGHPWITFKDPCNIRSPQKHTGVVHSSNLCTEITLNTSDDEIAVCNLGSVNLVQHLDEYGELNEEKIQRTVHTAIRMLDNVVDINYYEVDKSRNSNLKHRPIGMGIMGFHDALLQKRIPYRSEAAVEFADVSTEMISYYAIDASSQLAEERGSYSSFEGSTWSLGKVPFDTIEDLRRERGDAYVKVDTTTRMDWERLRTRVATKGMRNSNVMAIAPTATISNIVGVSASIDPIYTAVFVKSNLSGGFTQVNAYLIEDLKSLGMWDTVMATDLKYYGGSVQQIDRIPDDIKQLYSTAFEIEPKWLVECAGRRQKWIDQSQSLNIYCANAIGKELDLIYKNAWLLGLKTTYYLRSLAATESEKFTLKSGGVNSRTESQFDLDGNVCVLDDPDCEACQ